MTLKKLISSLPTMGRGLNTGKSYPKPLILDKPKKGLKRVSVKRQNELKEYNKIARQFLKANPKCEVYPHLPSVEVHHVAGRLGDFLIDTNFFMAVSREAHLKIHSEVKWAKSKGYIINRFVSK